MKKFATHHTSSTEIEDHILEFLYDSNIQNQPVSIDKLEKMFKNEALNSLLPTLEHMAREDMIAIQNREIGILPRGIKKAELLIRGHRLAQRLMVDVLGISQINAKNIAHSMEHILDEEVLNSLSAFLGYPDSSPDGKPIPNPRRKKVFSIKPVICRLSDMQIGGDARIKYIQNPGDLLAQMGILPGELIRLVQKNPSIILEIGQTTLALDNVIADTIFVHPI